MRKRPDLPTVILPPEELRLYLLSQLHLARPDFAPGLEGCRQLLATLRCIQLDPLDVLGTNADLVALARVGDIKRGDIYDALLPGVAFEHFAKERCLLPAAAFPWYRSRVVQTSWWRDSERRQRVPAEVIQRVLEEVEARGPLTVDDLGDHGKVERMDWNGWKGTGRASAMALEVLWMCCQVVVAGRISRGKVWDVPRRSLAEVYQVEVPSDAESFYRWALLERVEAAGLLPRPTGPWWSMLSDAQRGDLPERLVDEGQLERVQVEGQIRVWLAPRGFRERKVEEVDHRMRILGPLDPLLWDRKLVEILFGFNYVWEVYKPAAQRRFGWYVCPLLHRGRLVGRLEGRMRERTLVIDHVWAEPGAVLEVDALDTCLEQHTRALGGDTFQRPPQIEVKGGI